LELELTVGGALFAIEVRGNEDGLSVPTDGMSWANLIKVSRR
jgi:hypothetical protein